MKNERRVKLGAAIVDSGTLLVVDPCHVTQDQDSGNEPFIDDDWTILDYDMNTSDVPAAEVRSGVLFSTQIGDGSYDVVAVYDKEGLLLRVEILITEVEKGTDPLVIFCPACLHDDMIGVVQTNGSIALIDGRTGNGAGDYNWVGSAVGADGTSPEYSDDLTDQTDDAGRTMLICMNCHHEWPDDVPESR